MTIYDHLCKKNTVILEVIDQKIFGHHSLSLYEIEQLGHSTKHLSFFCSAQNRKSYRFGIT